MSRALRARRIAAAAAYGGGGVGLAGLATFGLLVAEAKVARWIVGQPDDIAPHSDGVYGSGSGEVKEALSLVMLGDSIAAGVGVDEPHETPAALIASGLSSVGERPVRLTSVARSGARTTDLEDQVTEALRADPAVAVIIIGGNDVLRRVPPAVAVRHLDGAVQRLRAAGCEVVVGTCPDLGSVQPIVQPLRNLVRYVSRQLAAAQTIAVVEAGGRTVSLGDVLAPAFMAAPQEMFGPDQFHPSARGYASAATALLPSAYAVVGLWPQSEEPPDSRRGDSVLPVYLAAAKAADESGTEVTGAEVSGRERGPRGRWARMLRWRGRGVSLPAEPDSGRVRDGDDSDTRSVPARGR